jgi:hypothetical protein
MCGWGEKMGHRSLLLTIHIAAFVYIAILEAFGLKENRR